MRWLSRFSRGELRLTRIEAFSDGVFAIVGPASYLVGAASAWFSVHAAFVIYLLTPLFYIVPPQARRITAPRARASASHVEPS